MKKRKKQEKIEGIQRVLEEHGRFDFDYIPFGPHWSMPGPNFPYRKKGLSLLACGFWRTLLFLLTKPFIGLLYGARVVGKENLRAIGKSGAVSVINHFSYLDTLFIRSAVGQFRSYHTMGPKNNKTGLGGHIIRHGGMLPFSTDLTALRNLNEEIGRLLEGGKIVNFYAEQALWTNYQKPRPMKDGAFHYAIKHRVPILPVFCTFRKDKRGHIRRLRINILPPIWENEALPRRERLLDLKSRAETAWKTCYQGKDSRIFFYTKKMP